MGKGCLCELNKTLAKQTYDLNCYWMGLYPRLTLTAFVYFFPDQYSSYFLRQLLSVVKKKKEEVIKFSK